jgi:hypothetical protein
MYLNDKSQFFEKIKNCLKYLFFFHEMWKILEIS